jgi:hypothetical protein
MTIATHNGGSKMRPPGTVWTLTALLGLFAFVSIVGSFIFAFPEGGLLGYGVGTTLVALGVVYVVIALRLRHGARWAWTAALIVPIVHVVAMSGLDLALLGAIPSENYPVLGLVGVIFVLLFVPSTRRFFDRSAAQGVA